jgi:hypothetical protein
MFSFSKFNGDISKWNVSNVKDMGAMFDESIFNGDISKWNVSNVTEMWAMFLNSIFNRDISKWNVSNVINMYQMFKDSQFNRNISNWTINPECKIEIMFEGCPIKDEYKPKSIINEAFDFNSVNKQKTPLNVSDIVIKNILNKVAIKDKTIDDLITKDEYKILISFTGIYPVRDI